MKILPIRSLLSLAVFCLLTLTAKTQNRQQLTALTTAEMRSRFSSPPLPYAHTMTFGLGDNLIPEMISRQLDSIYKQGIRTVSIEANYGSPSPYLSPGYMEAVKGVVQELKKRGMHLWIIDEGKYPSGFAGGLISQKAPEYRMQGLVSTTIKLKDGEAIKNQPLHEACNSAIAYNPATGESKSLDVTRHMLNWPGQAGNWQILIAEHRFKTSVTRAANNPTHGKDTVNALIDYLNPEATRKFMEFTHEQYKKYVGDEFGKTILGFRGDEPEYNFMPWSPKLPELFKQKKGYDIQPYLASFFLPKLTTEQQQAKADFSDVWSHMFRDNFFKVQFDWCAANGLEYIVHVNHEDQLMNLARSEGDYFKTMRYVQVPGVDAIWHQIWYDNVADFPKLASSAAHMYGRPQAFSESFAAYMPKPTVTDARWVVNEQMVRGINLFEWMYWGSGTSYLKDSNFAPLSEYANRAGFLLSNGRPMAKVAVYCPTETMWMGNKMADSSLRMLSRQLLEHQVDFDYVDRQGIASVFKLTKGGFLNASGQLYTTVIVPQADVMTTDVMNNLKAFTGQGGKVIFLDNFPALLAGKSFLHAKRLPKPIWAMASKWDSLDDGFYARLPHDLVLNKITPALKYLHRRWRDADLYFFFNESKEDLDLTITVAGSGKAAFWDANTANMELATGVIHEKMHSKLPLKLEGHGSRFLILEDGDDAAQKSEAVKKKAYLITDFGAVADTTKINTIAIQKTIDACAANGGGTVVIPKGIFVSGSVFLKAKVNMTIEAGGVLKGSVNEADYPQIDSRWEGEEQKWTACLLNGIGLSNIKLTGPGTIDGSGEAWTAKPRGSLKQGRPRLVGFQNCSKIEISKLVLHNQASWGLFVLYSTDVEINGLTIRAAHNIPSSDGIDIDSGNKIHIDNCDIDVNDDCISIKSGKDEDGRRVNRPSENILIENSRFHYGHGGVAMGSETSGGLRNITVQNCVSDSGNWAPVRFKTQPSRGGVVENITYKNITLNGTRKAFEFNMAWRMVNPRPPAAVLPVLRNIVIENVHGTVDAAGDMHGLVGSPIDGVRFINCNLTAKKGFIIENAIHVDTSGLKISGMDGPAVITSGVKSQ